MSQNIQENTCAGASFLIKLQALGTSGEHLSWFFLPGSASFVKLLQSFVKFLHVENTGIFEGMISEEQS